MVNKTDNDGHFQVGDVVFENFEDVITWAWKTHGLLIMKSRCTTYEKQVRECEIIHDLILNGGKFDSNKQCPWCGSHDYESKLLFPRENNYDKKNVCNECEFEWDNISW